MGISKEKNYILSFNKVDLSDCLMRLKWQIVVDFMFTDSAPKWQNGIITPLHDLFTERNPVEVLRWPLEFINFFIVIIIIILNVICWM